MFKETGCKFEGLSFNEVKSKVQVQQNGIPVFRNLTDNTEEETNLTPLQNSIPTFDKETL